MMRSVLKLLLALLSLYLVLSAALLAVMFQPPALIGAVMAKLSATPAPAILPFRALWYFARAGHLREGDVAPDFQLERLD